MSTPPNPVTTSPEADRAALARALELSHKASAKATYAVGCIIVNPSGTSFVSGFTGEINYTDKGAPSLPHAEEIALSKLPKPGSAVGWTLYSILEPCSERKSGREPCCAKIIKAGITRVVFGAKEPFDAKLGIVCRGTEVLKAAGIQVDQLKKMEAACLRAATRAGS